MKHVVIGGPYRIGEGVVLPISKAIRAGDFVFLSGQLGLDATGKLVPGSIADQTRQALRNIETVLAMAKCTLSNVVKVNVWIAGSEHFADFNQVYRDFFPASPPARTSVCSALLLPGALVEIEVVAFAPATPAADSRPVG